MTDANEALRERVKVLEEKWAVVFDSSAVVSRVCPRGESEYNLVIGTLDAIAAIGKERAARLREGGDQ